MARRAAGWKGLVGLGLVAVGVVGGVMSSRTATGPGPKSETEPEGAVGRLLAALDRRQRRFGPLAFTFAVVKKFGEDGAGRLAALIAYYGFFSVFPLTMALSAILGLVLESERGLGEDIRAQVADQVPFVGAELAQGTLEGSGLALAVGLALALWAGLAAIDAVQNGLNTVWHVPRVERPNIVGRRLRSVLMLAVVGLGLVAATVGTSVVSAAPLGRFAGGGLALASIAVNVGLYLVSFRVLCDRPLPWGALWPEALLAGVGTWALQSGFAGFLLRDTASAESTYGDFASVIVLLSWFFLLAQVTILAAEMNVVRHERLWPRSLTGRDLTEADRRALAAYARAETRVEGEVVAVELP